GLHVKRVQVARAAVAKNENTRLQASPGAWAGRFGGLGHLSAEEAGEIEPQVAQAPDLQQAATADPLCVLLAHDWLLVVGTVSVLGRSVCQRARRRDSVASGEGSARRFPGQS